MTGYSYEFDAEMSVLVRTGRGESPMIMRKKDPVWRHLGPEDESYRRAVFLGQGCWERLDTIPEERALRIMKGWGADL